MQISSPAAVVAFMATALIAKCCLSVRMPVQIIDCGGSPCTLTPFPPPPPPIIEPCPPPPLIVEPCPSPPLIIDPFFPPPPPASVTTCPPEIPRSPSQPSSGMIWPQQPYYALSPPNVYSVNPYYYTSGVRRSWSAMAILSALGVAVSLLWWC